MNSKHFASLIALISRKFAPANVWSRVLLNFERDDEGMKGDRQLGGFGHRQGGRVGFILTAIGSDGLNSAPAATQLIDTVEVSFLNCLLLSCQPLPLCLLCIFF